MSLDDIASGIVAALDTITNLRPSKDIPSVVNPSTKNGAQAFPAMGAITYDTTDDTRQVNWSLLVLLAQASERTAQAAIRAYADRDTDQSLKAALEADSTLSGTVMDLRVAGSTAPQIYTIAEVDYFGIEVQFWTID